MGFLLPFENTDIADTQHGQSLIVVFSFQVRDECYTILHHKFNYIYTD